MVGGQTAAGTGGTITPAPGASRSITLNPKNLGFIPRGSWNTTATVTGLSRILVQIQNDRGFDWSFAYSKEYAVPANGQAAIHVDFTLNGQVLKVSDVNDSIVATYSESAYPQ